MASIECEPLQINLDPYQSVPFALADGSLILVYFYPTDKRSRTMMDFSRAIFALLVLTCTVHGGVVTQVPTSPPPSPTTTIPPPTTTTPPSTTTLTTTIITCPPVYMPTCVYGSSHVPVYGEDGCMHFECGPGTPPTPTTPYPCPMPGCPPGSDLIVSNTDGPCPEYECVPMCPPVMMPMCVPGFTIQRE
ncbi:classical arabinogalactan protein 9-like [Aplysia californica]|uniref:Classical arabinogalactan protein 9-like n=1 Tax=Aplysia californica TaxID=6500 RepID=A0ABM1A6C7_APLCA|nr:classical arabinogalactan protein 9-like [Aplysia californica]